MGYSSLHPPHSLITSFFISPPLFFVFFPHLSSPLLILEHPLHPLFFLASLLACLGLTFPTDSIPHNLLHRSPTTLGRPHHHHQPPLTPQSSSYCSSLPWIGRNPFGQSTSGGYTATWGARSRSENGLPSVSKRPAEPAGIGVVGARLRLFPTSPVLSGPVRYGSLCDGAGTARRAPTAAPVERDGRRLAQDHPRLISRHFTCGAAARLPFLPQRLPDADRLELLR